MEPCDLCGRKFRAPGNIWGVVNRESRRTAVCTRCLELIIDVVSAVVDRRKRLPKKRPDTLARVLPVDVFPGVTMLEPPEVVEDVQRDGNVA